MMDVEGTSDIYIIGYLGQQDSQKTDIHFRCQDGNASFNWRMLLPLQIPTQKPLLTIQVYDKDIFASDDYISGATLNLKDLLTLPKYLGLPVKFTKTYYEGLTPDEQNVYVIKEKKMQQEKEIKEEEFYVLWKYYQKN